MGWRIRAMLVGQLSLLLFVVFVADAAITVWRRGDRRQALATGGSILFFALAAIVESVLVLWQIVDWPLTASFSFLGIVVAMGYEMSRETLRAAQLSDDLRESEERMTLAAEAAGFGVWMWSIARNQVWGSERWLRLFGFAPDAAVSFEKVIQRIHPDDRERVERGRAARVGGPERLHGGIPRGFAGRHPALGRGPGPGVSGRAREAGPDAGRGD